MKRFLVLCLTSWLVATAGAQAPEPKPAPLTKEQQAKLQERDRLLQEADQLLDHNQVDKGMALAEKALALTREVRGEHHSEALNLGQGLARAYEQQANFPAAKKLRQQVLAAQTQLHGQDHWQVTDARIALEDLERLARMAPADRRRLEEAEQLNLRVGHLLEQGKTQAALPLAQKALDIQKQVLGQRHPHYAASLNNLARLYESQGAYAQAEPLYRQALDICKQVLGERHPDYATGLNNLAELYEALGAYARAEPLFRQALDIRRQTLGEGHPDYARSLNNLAGLYESQGKYAEAKPLYQQALKIAKQALGERHPDYASYLNNLAALYKIQGEYAQAEPLYRQALEIKKQALGERHPAYAISLNNLAALYQSQGEYAQAEVFYRQTLGIKKQALGERHPSYAKSLNNLAELYREQGEYARAEALFRQALEIRKQIVGEGHAAYAESLNNLAFIYQEQREYAKAEPLFRQALEIEKQALGERHPAYASSLNDLALLYHYQGEYAQAESLYRQALDIRKQALGERHPDYASSLNNLAGLYYFQGKYAQAESLYRQALDIRKQTVGEHYPLYARSLNNLSGLYWSQGDYVQAESLLRQAIAALAQRPGGPPREFAQLTAAELRPLPETVNCLANYCILSEQRLSPRPTTLQLRSADHAFALALAVRERLRREVLEEDASKLQHGATFVDLIPQRIGLCRRLFDREGRPADLETALATAELGNARVFLEQLGKARALTVGRVSPALRQQEGAFRQKLRALDAQISREQARPSDQRDPERVGQLLDEQKQVEARLSELIQRMEQDYPQYAALKYPKPCSLAEARACLAPTEVALLFVPGDKHSYLVLVEARPARDDKGNGLAIYPLPSNDEIADGISRLTDRDTFEHSVRARAVAAATYNLLLAPLKERLRGKDLVIVAGGPLGYLPFEVLIEDGRYLIESHRIRYAPSLTALHLVRQWEQTRPKPERSLWAMADPIYDKADQRVEGKADLAQATKDALTEYLRRATRGASAAGVPYPRLYFSGQEARAIHAVLGAAGGDLLTGVQATEAAVKAASAKGLLAQARYVHFATHGILGLDTGQQPALVLSLVGNDGQRDADGGLNDGFLRLDEVTRLKLNADLVVLSACETGKGRLYAGEGVTGLARAFLYAGSRGVVASLWSVDDRETAVLMTRLYSELKDGQAAADALRAAKLAMIRANKPPLYWAPFILIGE
jgi:CHAT domain-containing protein/Tfp pilus assembly protein PilF